MRCVRDEGVCEKEGGYEEGIEFHAIVPFEDNLTLYMLLRKKTASTLNIQSYKRRSNN